MKTVGNVLCQRCVSLFDAVDSLESQLESARQNILLMLKVAVKTGGILQESDVNLAAIPPQETTVQHEVASQGSQVSKVEASLITTVRIIPVGCFKSPDKASHGTSRSSSASEEILVSSYIQLISIAQCH